jgi:hypothetical protein
MSFTSSVDYSSHLTSELIHECDQAVFHICVRLVHRDSAARVFSELFSGPSLMPCSHGGTVGRTVLVNVRVWVVRRTIFRTQTRTVHRTDRRSILISVQPSVRLSVGAATVKIMIMRICF